MMQEPHRLASCYGPRLVDRRSRRRQQILQTARDVIAKRGYHHTTIEDIVRSAGVARGTFYLYFTDKRAVFAEIVDRMMAKLAMAILRVDPADAGRSVDAQVRENITRIVHTLLEDRATTKILLTDALGVDPGFDAKLNAFYDEMTKLMDESLRDGQELGLVADGNTRIYAFLTIGALKELLYQVVIRGIVQTEEEVVDSVFGFLRSGYLRVDAGR